MATELRKTGISVVGDIPWGTHFCTFYETTQDLLDILLPYFKAGVENSEFSLLVISNSELLTVQEAISALRNAVPDLDRHLAERRIEIVEHDAWFLEAGAFDLYRVANQFKEKLDDALARGYVGMRMNGSPAWLLTRNPQQLREFEQEFDRLFRNERVIASCTYPLAGSGADELLDVAGTHQFAIARRQGKWEMLETPELIQAKQEIQRLNVELEQRVSERTSELAATNEALQVENAERKRAEALLYASEQEFRAIVENAPDHIIRYDRDFSRTYANPAVAQTYGLPAEAMIDKPIGSVIQDAGLVVNADELAQIRQRIAAVFDTGTSYEYEMNWPAPMGRRYYSVRLFPERELNGSVINVLSIARDITERKRAENELRQQKEILQKIFDYTPVMIAFVGQDGRVELVNRTWERSLGWTLHELEEQHLDIYALAYPDPQYRQQVLDFVAAATGEWTDLKVRVRDGQVIDMTVAIVHLTGGTSLVIAQDITERKRTEAERARLFEEVQASHAQLQTLSRQLLQAQEAERRALARELHDEIGQQLTGLSLLITTSQQLPPEQAQARLAQVQALVRDLMEQVRSLALDLRPAMLDDLGLVPALVWLFERYTTQTDVSVRFEHSGLEEQRFAPDLEITAYRIVQEALTNVARHAGVREVIVRLWTDAATLSVIIVDQGRGFDIQTVQRGASSGLAGMLERAALLGGGLTIESAPGTGTRVTASLPLHSDGEPREQEYNA